MPRPRSLHIPDELLGAAQTYIERVLQDDGRHEENLVSPRRATGDWAGLAEGDVAAVADWVDQHLTDVGRRRFQNALRQYPARQKRKRVRITLELDPADAKRLKELARLEATSPSLVIAALVQYAYGTKGWRSKLRAPRR